MAGVNISTKTGEKNVVFMVGGLLRLCLSNVWYSGVSEGSWNNEYGRVGWGGCSTAPILSFQTASFSRR